MVHGLPQQSLVVLVVVGRCCRLGSWVDEMDGRWVDLIGKDETGWEDGEDG